jgi:hypothetical protein
MHGSFLGTWECAALELRGEVTVNQNNVVGAKTGAFAYERCMSNGNPITVNNMQWTKLASSGSETDGTIALVIETSLAGLTCRWTSVTPTPFYFSSGSGTISLSGGKLTSTPAGCGTMSVSGSFKLESVHLGVRGPDILLK